MINTQFEKFKKCVAWSKRANSWTGTFCVDKSPTCGGFCYSVTGTPDQPARTAKPEIMESLYAHVCDTCALRGINLDHLIAEKMLAKARNKK